MARRLLYDFVGLSLGYAAPLNRQYVLAQHRLSQAVQPVFVSEHLSWGSIGGAYLSEFPPLPYTDEALVSRVSEVQDFLGRQIRIENISSHRGYPCSEAPEWEFLSALLHDSGCGLTGP